MAKEYKEMLVIFSGIKTPTWKKGWANDTYDEVCDVYCKIRNLAKDMLVEKYDNNKNRKKIIGLLTRASKLEKEVLV